MNSKNFDYHWSLFTKALFYQADKYKADYVKSIQSIAKNQVIRQINELKP